MQLINLETLKATVLTSDEGRQLLAAVGEGRLQLDLEKTLDRDGDLVLEDVEYDACLKWIRQAR